MKYQVADEQSMEMLGRQFSRCVRGGDIVFFQGELGAGKTTFVRGLLTGLGHKGSVTSPTYTLIEPYSFEDLMVYHLDLYRLNDPDELEMIGLRDLIGNQSILLVEWPDRGQGVLTLPSVTVSIEYRDSGRDLEIVTKDARQLTCEANA